MGWRAVRVSLDRPGLLRTQLRALIRASAGQPLDVMFPMVVEVSEFDRCRRVLDRELDHARAAGIGLPAPVRVGAMLEVPALLFELPELLSRVDFVSVGTNDLLQFLSASDRGNPLVSGRYDTLSPAVLRMLWEVHQLCDRAGRPCTVCGEMAGRPLEAMALVGLGFTRLSMAAGALGPVKAMVRALDTRILTPAVIRAVRAGGDSLRPVLKLFARDHGIPV